MQIVALYIMKICNVDLKIYEMFEFKLAKQMHIVLFWKKHLSSQ